MANNTIWQISHYLAIAIHLILFIVGIAIYSINRKSGDAGDAKTTTVWAVGGVVSCMPPPPSSHSQKAPILMNLFIQGIAGFICMVILHHRLLDLQRASPVDITQEAYYLKRKITYMSSIILQSCLVIADIASGAVVVEKVSVFGNLAAPVTFAFIAA